MRRGRLAGAVVCVFALAGAAPASGQLPVPPPPGSQPIPPPAASPATPELRGITQLGPDHQRLQYSYGPLEVTPGANLILIGPVTIEKPGYDGFVTRFKPDLLKADGTPPPVDVIHLHHGVWLNMTGNDRTAGTPERIAASGEEKTILDLPRDANGDPIYGYPVEDTDVWAINHMLHNQTTEAETVWITYEIDYVKKDSDLGRSIKPAYPVWMDVCNGEAYPVFDVKRGSGGDGEYTFPDEASSPTRCSSGKATGEEWRVPEAGTLVWAGGHVHPGGLATDLSVKRGTAQRLLFRSEAEYFGNKPPVSWDMAMTVTPNDWRAALKPGDRLRVTATYETQIASWYESMGIMIAMFAPGDPGPDPFVTQPQTTGAVTHGHLPENDNFGGEVSGLPDPSTLPDGRTIDNRVGIFAFVYTPGNMGFPSFLGNPPVVKKGVPLRFENGDAAAQVFHTVTECEAPCTRTTGIGYPLANGATDFDSGELGYGPNGFTAAANRYAYSLDTSTLDANETYTYFCRVHPYMRGSFRVVE